MRARKQHARKRSPALPLGTPTGLFAGLGRVLQQAEDFVGIVGEEAFASGKITGARIRQELRRP